MTEAQQRYAEKWAFQHFALEMLSRDKALTEAELEEINLYVLNRSPKRIEKIGVGRLQKSIYIPENNTLILEMFDGDTEFQLYVTMESEAVRDSFNEDTLFFKFRYCLTFDHNAFFDEDDVRHWTVARSIEELKALGVI